MNKTYFKDSFYYPDDKDIYDFLAGSRIPREDLENFLAGYGIFASQYADDESLFETISLLHHDWDSCTKLINLATIRETKDKWTKSEHTFSGEKSGIIESINDVREMRSLRDKEDYSTEEKDGKVVLTVTYRDTNPGKTRLFQQVEKEVVVEIENTPDGVSVRHSSNDRAKAIVANLLGSIQSKDESEEQKSWEVDLSSVLDTGKRVKFFDDLMKGMNNFNLVDVLHVKVDRMPDQMEEIVLMPEEEEDDEEADELGENIRKVILYGKNLLSTTEYETLVNRGFFISSVTWQSELQDGSQHRLEFVAGFGESVSCKNFEYRVVGEYKRGEDGHLKTTRENLKPFQARPYIQALEASAKVAYQNAIGELTDE